MMSRQPIVDSLRGLHSTTKPRANPSGIGQARGGDCAACDFRTLPGFRAVNLARSAAEALGLPSPFFRQIDCAEGTRVQINGRWVENFASYDYLSLNRSAGIAAAVERAVRAHGVSATASRLVGGDHAVHHDLEEAIAAFTGAEAALAFVSGHATNLAVLRTLLGPKDLVAVDSLAHNSVYEGIRISGAHHITFPHNDWQALDHRLTETRGSHERVLIAIEGLYSMDGDMPDLPQFVALKRRHEAWLMIDEAHSIGVLGASGRGICEETGVDPTDVDILMGTLSKTFCSAGGFIAGSRDLIDLMRFQAPGFVYSVGLSIPNTAAALAALSSLRDDPSPVMRLRRLGAHFQAAASALELDAALSQGLAVAPVIIGDSLKAVWISGQLLERGFNVLPIIAPAVPERSARLRFFLNADHAPEQIDVVLQHTAELVVEARKLRFS